MTNEKLVQEVVKRLMDNGLIIEAGYTSFKIAVYGDKQLPLIQEEELHNTFFAGSAHLFASIINSFDKDEEATEEDMKRMDKIAEELQRFQAEFLAKYGL